MNRQQAVDQMKQRLDEWNHDIDLLSARSNKYLDKSAVEYRQTLQNLRIKKENARDELERLENASDAAFEDLRSGLEKGWKKVAESFETALERYN